MEQDLKKIKRIEISPNIVYAYLLEMVKAVAVILAVVGAYFLVIYILGQDPFLELLDTLGIPAIWAIRVFVALSCLLMLAVFFNTLSLTSYSLLFEGDDLTYSCGSFFKKKSSTNIANIIRVNFKEHSPLKLGDLVIDLSGTAVKSIKVDYVRDAKHMSEIINKLIVFKKSQQVEEINENGVV